MTYVRESYKPRGGINKSRGGEWNLMTINNQEKIHDNMLSVSAFHRLVKTNESLYSFCIKQLSFLDLTPMQ